jgi:glucose-6-phosphate 1-dehydrogenase
VAEAETLNLGPDVQRLHYLSVPPKAARAVITMLREAGLVERSRIIMEKPFGTDLASAIALNDYVHETFANPGLPDRPLPGQGGGPEHPGVPLRQRSVRADLEPQLHRPHPDRHSRNPRPGSAGELLREHRRLQGHGGDPPLPGDGLRGDGAADRARTAGHQRREEQGVPVDAADQVLDVVRGQYSGYRERKGVAKDSDTETFIALKVGIDNWRWAGVPIYLRTGKQMAEGIRIISIAFKEAPRTMFPAGSGVGAQGPDHLTFDLADRSKVSLSFYGKRPGPGMKLDKLSMQFSSQEVDTSLMRWRPTSGSSSTRCVATTPCSPPPRASNRCGSVRSNCSTNRHRSRTTRPVRGGPTPFIN